MIRVAINGFGRIGRAAFKIAQEMKDIEVVAINDLTNARVLAHLLKYDTVYGIYPKEISVIEGDKRVEAEGKTVMDDHFLVDPSATSYIEVGNWKSRVISVKDPAHLPWKEIDVDVGLECTGRFTEDGSARAHIKAGAKRVIVSAPVKGAGDIKTFLLGANQDKYSGEDIISNASCTTNCITPVASIMVSKFGVEKAMMTTAHAVTAEQNLVDGPPPALHPDLRRGRSAFMNIVPTTTGAAKSAGEAIPELKGIFDGTALRVPVSVGSISDFTFLLKKDVTVEGVNQAFIDARSNPFYKDVVDVVFEPITSSDVIGNPHSAIVDLTLTKVVGGNMVKVFAWYDNEWGYSTSLVKQAINVGKSI